MMIAIIDCAIKKKSLPCINEIAKRNKIPLTYLDALTPDLNNLKELKADGYIIFGSASNVKDNLPWQREIQKIILQKLNNKIPVMGICFGHQLMAEAFGASIRKNSNRLSGTRKVEIISNYKSLKKGSSYTLIKEHSYEIKTLPKDFLHIGSSPECKYDIITHKSLPFIGYQCHPEASLHFIKYFNTKINQNTTKALNDGAILVDNFIMGI